MLQELLVSDGGRLRLSEPPPRRCNHHVVNSFPQVMEDPLQSQRLKYAFESEKGLLGGDAHAGKSCVV